MVEIPLSKDLSIRGCTMRVWNLIVKINSGKTNRVIIKIDARKANITAALSCTVDQSQRHLRAAIGVYQQKKHIQGT